MTESKRDPCLGNSCNTSKTHMDNGDGQEHGVYRASSSGHWVFHKVKLLLKEPVSVPAKPDPETGASDHSTGPVEKTCSCRQLVLVLAILVVLTVLALLFFWNYQCTMVYRLCDDSSEILSAPLFNSQQYRDDPEN